MNREADYSIKGFLYQFNKTLQQILTEPEESEITVEGIIEDIDVSTPKCIKAIQCKYHETKRKYKLSDIYKPILQMLVHYSQNKDADIQYILYAHFSKEKFGDKQLTEEDFDTILSTQNQQYVSNYISQIKPPNDPEIKDLVSKVKRTKDETKRISEYYKSSTGLEFIIDITNFNKPDKFKFILGKSYDDIIKESKKLMEQKCNFSEKDVEELFYPNAIQMIADKSIKHNSDERIIETKAFLNKLEVAKKTAISRWTKELLSYHKLLKKRREQLSENLKQNHRLRYFIFDAESIDDFENKIVSFIDDYISRYHFKIKLHTKTPLFCIKTSDKDLLLNIESRLYKKGISVTTGIRGKDFYERDFFREPERIINKNWFEFRLRICILTKEIIKSLNKNKCDDLFYIGSILNENIDILDINAEKIDVSNFNELKYLLNLSRDLE